MELILSRPGLFRSFSAEWNMKWVPAIIAYCKGLKKRRIAEVFSSHDDDSTGKWTSLHAQVLN